MSAKSKKSSKEAAIDRPFDAEVLRRAREIASQYQIVIWHEDGKYYGQGLEYPEAMGEGKNPDACVESVREGMVAGLATMLEMGDPLPVPAREGVRRRQINIRISDEEKLRLETAAKQKGFVGISDYVRSQALKD